MKYIAKKNYTTPIVETYKLKPQHVLTTSRLNPEETNPSVVVSNETLEDGWFSARGSDWDED